VEHYAQVRRRVLAEDPGLRHRLSALRRLTLRSALLELGYPETEATQLAEGAFLAMLEARHRIDLFPDTLPTLQQLTRHYRLGAVTNGNADVRRLGLADYFDFALCAEELGVGKPDRRPFDEALARGAVSATQAVHVGDHPGDDILGAQAAGWRAVWFNPLGHAWQGDGAPDAQIRRLGELPALLQAWSAGQAPV